MLEEIRVKKAAQHNLKRIDVDLPRNKLIVVTGPSRSWISVTVPTVDRGLEEMVFWSMEMDGERPSIDSISGFSICSMYWRA